MLLMSAETGMDLTLGSPYRKRAAAAHGTREADGLKKLLAWHARLCCPGASGSPSVVSTVFATSPDRGLIVHVAERIHVEGNRATEMV